MGDIDLGRETMGLVWVIVFLVPVGCLIGLPRMHLDNDLITSWPSLHPEISLFGVRRGK